ncbi:MAG: GNAT family N-acetyltransferase, partial [Bacteroidota bacterium]
MTYQIRPVERADLPRLVALCAAHAAFEKADYNPEGKQAGLERDLFGDPPKLFCLLAEIEGEGMGYATFMKQYATWESEEYIYMDCLYLDEKARSQGIGEALIEKIKEAGREMGCSLIQWQTPDFNTQALIKLNGPGIEV